MPKVEALEIYDKIIYGNMANGELFVPEREYDLLKAERDAAIRAISEEGRKRGEIEAERDRLFEIAYPDGPQADAAVPMSRYEPLLKSERKLRDRLVILEAEVERYKEDIKMLFRILGPAKPTCIGCAIEVEEALKVIKQAISGRR